MRAPDDELRRFQGVRQPGDVPGDTPERLAELTLRRGPTAVQPPNPLGARAGQSLSGEPVVDPLGGKLGTLLSAADDHRVEKQVTFVGDVTLASSRTGSSNADAYAWRYWATSSFAG